MTIKKENIHTRLPAQEKKNITKAAKLEQKKRNEYYSINRFMRDAAKEKIKGGK